MKKKGTEPYHHGDLHNALLVAARAILEKKGLETLSLREVARKAGVSHAAPYRHFKGHEALLAALATEGFTELRAEIVASITPSDTEADRITAIAAGYMRFVTGHPALARLMFGPQLPHRNKFPELAAAAEGVGADIGNALDNPTLGLAAWAAVHGTAMLALENLIDLGQSRSGTGVLPSRAEILLRGLFTAARS
ncbi:MAG TPA: TetR/AcrR family transcriptional regulator [Rhizomicrobium sp.]|nr:TetR/AcrR family transcriptional regulator [Rhizomicrobium sp.]HEX4534422.1 TetR/AcrR family transcriptional regulator [Rhizomicrobium sp.]